MFSVNMFSFDQVQSGFGRTGTHFWGYEGHGAKPDIGNSTLK